ncbi:thiol reductant ABC exporter subunit CydC [Sporolactobacillus sp. THM19-2]|uniref:thiol reductant ABC exporter subunit CydC n=1 Tax=Sporolactobacillus sp. THM19-2 TaxID=2511171 RepID=UPI00101FA2F3|nr:thiol reductant ABC exporter subunit CydC [Sporolactobacillus sp. THM19-2]RYL90292.1 thiol reductant ABC exporter subunit CydC [Sporolactobacillus sp. THM19-2]
MKEWFVPYAQKHWRGLVLSAVLMFFALFCAAGLLFTSGYLISKAALQPENILMIYVPIVGVRAFGIFRAVFQYAGRLTSHSTILRILSEMRIRLYHCLEPAALFIRSRFRTGDLLGVLSDDIEHLQDIFLRTALPGGTALLIYALWIGFLGWFDPVFAILLGLYFLILLVVFPLVSLMWAGKAHKRLSGIRHGLYDKLTDAVLGAGDWMMSGRQKDFISSYEGLENQSMLVTRRLNQIKIWRDFVCQLLIGLAVIFLLIWSGHMASGGHMQSTLIAAFVLVTFTISESFVPVSEAVERLPQYREAFTRLSKVDKRDPDLPSVADSQPVRPDMREIVIEANHVFYRYKKKDEWALQDLSFRIGQGERVALIGRSGAGKTTLIHTIYGALRPSRGSLTLNGVLAYRFGDNMSEYIAVLDQNPHLFDTSVRNNLALGNEQATEEELVQAAKAVGLHELIEQLPKGYRTQMHEAGSIFSGGEQERLALARILLKQTPVVILDEPTVGLDPITEKKLLQTIFSTLKGKTLIWITHHLTGAEKMDQIFFMENGRFCMKGDHRHLMRTYPRYRRLYQLDVPDHLKHMLDASFNEDI